MFCGFLFLLYIIMYPLLPSSLISEKYMWLYALLLIEIHVVRSHVYSITISLSSCDITVISALPSSLSIASLHAWIIKLSTCRLHSVCAVSNPWFCSFSLCLWMEMMLQNAQQPNAKQTQDQEEKDICCVREANTSLYS